MEYYLNSTLWNLKILAMEVNMAFSKKRRMEYFNRKMYRYSKVGFQQEENVLKILERAREKGEFLRVEKHRRHSEADNAGKDFTVTKIVDEDEVSRSFGITISPRRRIYSRLIHPDTPQFLFPLATKPETIIKAINRLFT